MVLRFAYLSVVKEVLLKSTIRWNALLFDWRSFSTITTDLTLCGCCPPFNWATVSLTGGSVPSPRRHTHCRTFVSSLYFTSTSNYFDTSFLVTLWAVVNHCHFLLRTIWVAHIEHSFNGHQLHCQWAYEFWNRCYPLWLLEVFHNAMLRGQVLEVSASPKAHIEYKRRRYPTYPTNAYPTFVQHANQLLTSRHSMDHHSQVDRGYHSFSGYEVLKRTVPNYLPPIILYVQVSFSLRKVVSTETTLTLSSSGNCSTIGLQFSGSTSLICLDSRGARLRIHCSSVIPKEMNAAST